MELQVGQYVRTKTGIHQIYRIDNNKTKWKYVYKLKEQDGDGCINCGVLSSEDIIGEPSFDIIDVIQEGDYVNGRIVDEFIYLDKLGLIGLNELEKEDEKFIKTIVTREQFEAMAYRIGE